MKPRSKRAVAVIGVPSWPRASSPPAAVARRPTSTTTAAANAAAPAAPPAPGPGGGRPVPRAARAKLAACLKKHGVTLPGLSGGGGRIRRDRRRLAPSGGASARPARPGLGGSLVRRAPVAPGTGCFPGGGPAASRTTRLRQGVRRKCGVRALAAAGASARRRRAGAPQPGDQLAVSRRDRQLRGVHEDQRRDPAEAELQRDGRCLRHEA